MDLNIIERLKKNYEEAQQQANKTGEIKDILEVCSKLETLNKALGILKYDCENLAKRAKEKYKAKNEEEEKIKTKELFFENYTEAEFDAFVEKKLEEAIKRGVKESLKYTKKELLEQMIAIDDEGEESLLAWEQAKEQEEDERDEREKKARERRAEKKRLKVVRKRELDRAFYEEWADKIKALKAFMPDTENLSEGRGKERKYRAYFRQQTTLFLQEIKNLNIGGGI